MKHDWEETRAEFDDTREPDQMPRPIPDLTKMFIEKLAALEHQQWMEWAQSIMDSEQISDPRKIRWKKLMIPYSDLSEEMKDHDRKWALKVFELMKKHIDD